MFSVSAVESCILASREPAARFYFVKLFILEKSKETANLWIFTSTSFSCPWNLVLRGIRLCSKIVFFLAVVELVIVLSDSLGQDDIAHEEFTGAVIEWGGPFAHRSVDPTDKNNHLCTVSSCCNLRHSWSSKAFLNHLSKGPFYGYKVEVLV